VLLGAEFPDPPLASLNSNMGEFITDEPIPECRVVMVNVVISVDGAGIDPLSLGQRILLPFIEGPFAKPNTRQVTATNTLRRASGAARSKTSGWIILACHSWRDRPLLGASPQLFVQVD